MTKVVAPFTEEQVKALNGWQQWGQTHPFTCLEHSTEPLRAKTDGWHCEVADCGYTQNWAHDFMAAAKFCTKDDPCIPASVDPSEYWIHTDAVETNPVYEGEIIGFHCPNCGLDFNVDLR